MVKKISAVLLALVLCFSVVVLPASATGFESGYTLPEGKKIAYKIELDKESYKAGDTVTVKVYMNLGSDLEFNSGALGIGVSTAVFDTTTNTAAKIKASATSNETYNSFFNAANSSMWSWAKAGVVNSIKSFNTSEENSLFDQYLKFGIARNLTSGTHPNAGTNTAGLPAADINGETEPFFTFKLKIRDDVADGTPISVGLTSGSFKSKPITSKAQVYIAGVVKDVEPDAFDLSQAVATATVGAPAPAGPAVTKAKSQVKMKAMSANTVDDEFSFRVISKISDSDWDIYFKNTGVKDAKDSYITAVGMVAYKGAAAFDADTAKRVVAGESVADYTAATTDYISKVNDTADAEFGAIIKAKHSTLNNDVTYMGFVQYVDASGNAQTIFYETAGTAALSTNYDNIVNAYLKAYPFAA